MMNNGKLQESLDGDAWLEEVDPETFRLAAEFMCTGVYRVERAENLPPELLASPPPEQPRLFEISCTNCGRYGNNGGTSTVEHLLFSILTIDRECSNCGNDWTSIKDLEDNSYLDMSQFNNHQQSSRRCGGKKRHDRLSVFAPPVALSSSENAFRKLSFPVLNKSHEDYGRYLCTFDPPDRITEKVCYHAMLFIFAQMYMMEPLAKICFHKLHMDLSSFTPTVDNISELVELLTYTYENTASMTNVDEEEIRDSNDDNVEPTLRHLVITCAITHAKILSKYSTFQTMLQKGGELVGDYTRGITERLGT